MKIKFIEISLDYPVRKKIIINTTDIKEISSTSDGTLIKTFSGEHYLVSETYDDLKDMLLTM